MTIDNRQLASMLQEELNEADGGPDSALDANRREALSYYYGRLRNVVDGRSQLQSGDVADMVEAVIAQMTPALSDTNIARFDPLSEDDERQAEIESAMVADQLYQENDGFLEISQAVKDGVLLRTGWLKVYMESDEDVTTFRYDGQTAEAIQLAVVTTPENESLEIVSQEESGSRLLESGERQQLYSGEMRRTIRHQRLKVCAVRTEDMAYSAGWKKPTVDGVRFVAERQDIERGELVEMGVSRTDAYEVGPKTSYTTTGEQARTTTHTVQLGGKEPSTELVEVWECYIRADLEENGQRQLWRALYADNRVLLKEQVPFAPYINGWALLRPYRVDGISLHDKLKQTEDAKTTGLRQWADNIYNMNNVRSGLVEGQVRISDFITSRPGGYVMIKSPDAIVPLVSQDAGDSSLRFLEYQDKARSERGGASLDLQSAEAQVAGHTAQGTERQYTARELLASLMVRNVAETLIRGVFRLIHRTMRTHNMGELAMKRAGEWQRQDPRQWKERSRLTVNLGLTVNERLRRQASLREVVQLNMQGLQAGLEGELVDKPGLYRAVVDLGEAGGLPAPEQYYVNPETEEARAAAQAKQQAAAEQRQEMTATRAALLELTLTQERYQHDTELRFNYFKELLGAEVKEAEIVGGAVGDLAKIREQARTAASGNGAETAQGS